MKITDFEDSNLAVLIEIPYTEKKVFRKFTLTGNFYEILKK